jgi:hypothetical protein
MDEAKRIVSTISDVYAKIIANRVKPDGSLEGL